MRSTGIITGGASMPRAGSPDRKAIGSGGGMVYGGFCEDELLSDEHDLSVEPDESEYGLEAFDELVFGDDTYNSMCESIRGQRIWDLPEDYR